ncbi:MAG: chromosome segregation protein [Bacteroidota bacterium]|nr:chromosome segregation protein [Bacteroidota bacterium]
MIPLSLILKGIYSYREEQQIDFTRLTEANIFGIFGAVGSGKSTILEAISFALYGETERLNQRDNRNYNMMNLKSDELLIDFIFKTGYQDGEYRFIAKGKRNSKAFEKVGTFERTAYKKSFDSWEPIDVLSVEKIIGLSYDNFRRTVIIPQNQFQEFLQLGDKDRTQMMKELFHLQRFELDDKVKVLEAKNNEARTICTARMAQIGPVTEEEIILSEEQLKAIRTNIADEDKVIKEKQKAELEFKNLKELLDRVSTQQQKVTGLQSNSDSVKELERQLKEYEYCLLNFKNLIDNHQSLKKSISAQQADIRVQQNKQQGLQKQLKENETVFTRVKNDFENREQLNTRGDELNKVISIKKLEAEEKVLDERILKGNNVLIDVQTKIAALNEEQNLKRASLAKLKKNADDVVLISTVREWFIIKNGIEQNILKAKKEKNELENEIKAGRDKQLKLFSKNIKEIVGPVPSDSSSFELTALLENAIAALKKEVLDIIDRLHHLNAQNKLEEYASSLKEGELCPICGATEHPHILNITDVKTAIQTAQNDKSLCSQKVDMLDDTLKKFSSSITQLEGHQKNLEKLNIKLAADEAQLKKHNEKFTWNNFDRGDEAALEKAFAKAQKDRNQITELDEALIKLSAALEEESKLSKKYEDGLKGVTEEKARKSSAISTLHSQLKISDYSSFSTNTEVVLQQEMTNLKNQYELAGKEFQRIDTIISQLKNEDSQLKGSIEAGLKNLGAAQDSLTEIETAINQKLKDSAYSSLDQVEALLKSNFNIEEERKKINSYNLQLHSAQEQLSLLQEQAAGKIYEDHQHQVLINEINELQKVLDAHIAERERLINLIKSQKESLALLQKLQQQLDELNLRKEDINTLKQLFKAGGFVNYISSVYLQNLCNEANERFYQLTRQKLKLEINENNNFQVRDFMNNGQVRSVKTLSGGQTFQAALSLALALADSIQTLTKSRQNFFFLDEGFGSLDKESLQIVFDTLQTLRKENRVVGVISHVEEMQLEIDTYLKITNDEERGSIISPSWVKN